MLKADTKYSFKAGIYRITCTANNKSYIGSSVNILERWREHISHLRAGIHHSVYLQRCYNKYGEDSIKFEVLAILENFSEELLRLVEFVYIEKLKPELNTITPIEVKMTEQWKKKISDSTKKLYENGYTNPRFNTGKRYNVFDFKGNIVLENKTIREIAIFVGAKDYHFFNTVMRRNGGIAIWNRGVYIIAEVDKTKQNIFQAYKNGTFVPEKFGIYDSNGITYFGQLDKHLNSVRKEILKTENLQYVEDNIVYTLPGIPINAV